LAFVPGKAAEKLLLGAEAHPDTNVRLEAMFALARRGHPGSDDKLVQAALDPATSELAVAYLEELGKGHLVPEQVAEPVFAATAQMISWLAHPMEFGRAPEAIELWDRRTIHWPPTDDERELFLFRFSYPKTKTAAASTGVGLVGSVTFSLAGDARPDPRGTPEDALARHCVWELEHNEDPRAGDGSLEVGRRLLGFKQTRKKRER